MTIELILDAVTVIAVMINFISTTKMARQYNLLNKEIQWMRQDINRIDMGIDYKPPKFD
jgi:hypothetical protein